MANKKISELTELPYLGIRDDDVLIITDVNSDGTGLPETKKARMVELAGYFSEHAVSGSVYASNGEVLAGIISNKAVTPASLLIGGSFPSGSNAGNIQTIKNISGSVIGNMRGVGSVDFQQIRSSNTSVASGLSSAISGGENNQSSGDYSTVGGGKNNTASGYYSFIGGGTNNTAAAGYNTEGATVCGGCNNTSGGNRSFVGAGIGNTSSGIMSVVCGGENNTAIGNYPTITGGKNNTSSGDYSFVGGGKNNITTSAGYHATIVGGSNNTISGRYSSICGGNGNIASGRYSSIDGGAGNIASGWFSSVCGRQSTASGYGSTISGGQDNISLGNNSVVGGGISNKATGSVATIGGGSGSLAIGDYTTISGGSNNISTGSYSAIGGGLNNVTSGSYSTITGGYGAVASRYGMNARANGYFSSIGDAQMGNMILRNTTTGSSLTELFADGNSAVIYLYDNETIGFDAQIVGRRIDSRIEDCYFTTSGLVKRGIGSGSVSLISSSSINVIARPNTNWSASVDANTANGSLRFQVVGEFGKTIRWVSNIRFTEIVG